MSNINRTWNLESFVDALVIELDKTRETLALKALNRPLTYSVKDLALDLQIFPTYDGDAVSFKTAQPGEEGASKISIQLASITDNQIRATSKKPMTKDDIEIEQIDVDPETKRSLRKLGVTSVNDLEEMEKRNVDIERAAPGKVNYTRLANLIKKSKRNRQPPVVRAGSLIRGTHGEPLVIVQGENLAVQQDFEPVAVMDRKLARILYYDAEKIIIAAPDSFWEKGEGELIITPDPYSLFKINVKSN